MTSDEFKKLWASLNENQRENVRTTARWEAMTLWAVCIEWPDIWNQRSTK